MNDRQAEALRYLIEREHPDAAVTVTAESDGAHVVITGPGAAVGSFGQGSVEMCLSDASPYVFCLLYRHGLTVPLTADLQKRGTGSFPRSE